MTLLDPQRKPPVSHSYASVIYANSTEQFLFYRIIECEADFRYCKTVIFGKIQVTQDTLIWNTTFTEDAFSKQLAEEQEALKRLMI